MKELGTHRSPESTGSAAHKTPVNGHDASEGQLSRGEWGRVCVRGGGAVPAHSPGRGLPGAFSAEPHADSERPRRGRAIRRPRRARQPQPLPLAPTAFASTGASTSARRRQHQRPPAAAPAPALEPAAPGPAPAPAATASASHGQRQPLRVPSYAEHHKPTTTGFQVR